MIKLFLYLHDKNSMPHNIEYKSTAAINYRHHLLASFHMCFHYMHKGMHCTYIFLFVYPD